MKKKVLWVLKDLFHSWLGHMYAINSLTLPNMLSRTKKLLTGWVETWHSYIPLSRFCRYFICKCIRAFDTWLFNSVLCHLKYPLICGWIINGLISVICSVGITTHGQYMQVCMPYPRDLKDRKNNLFQIQQGTIWVLFLSKCNRLFLFLKDCQALLQLAELEWISAKLSTTIPPTSSPFHPSTHHEI